MKRSENVRADDLSIASLSEPVRAVLDALNTLRFGAIQLTVHEGRLVQVDITERKRFGS